MKRNRHIIIIGFMGTGKSYFGARFAQAASLPFIDLDEEIMRLESSSISDIFAKKGEQYFREIESELLEMILLQNQFPIVLATGGGTVLREKNRKIMGQYGIVVRTEAHRDEIIRRLRFEQANRPLIAGSLEERVDQLLQERKNVYDFAHLTVFTDRISIQECIQQVLNYWQQYK